MAVEREAERAAVGEVGTRERRRRAPARLDSEREDATRARRREAGQQARNRAVLDRHDEALAVGRERHLGRICDRIRGEPTLVGRDPARRTRQRPQMPERGQTEPGDRALIGAVEDVDEVSVLRHRVREAMALGAVARRHDVHAGRPPSRRTRKTVTVSEPALVTNRKRRLSLSCTEFPAPSPSPAKRWLGPEPWPPVAYRFAIESLPSARAAIGDDLVGRLRRVGCVVVVRRHVDGAGGPGRCQRWMLDRSGGGGAGGRYGRRCCEQQTREDPHGSPFVG